jgi:hypothetical protein
MTSKPLVALALGAVLVCSSHFGFAAAAPGPKARVMAKFDTNRNNVIDGNEIAEVRAAFAANPKGDLARYDTNQNGKLEDAEIAEIKPPGQKGAKGGRKDKDTGGQEKATAAK